MRLRLIKTDGKLTGCKVDGDTTLEFEKLALTVVEGMLSLVAVFPIKDSRVVDDALIDGEFIEHIEIEI